MGVDGRSGFNAEINGDYHLLPKLHRNRPCYKKLNSSWCIRWNSNKTEWMIDCDGLKDDDIACARNKNDCIHPALATNPWRIYNNPQNVEDRNVRLSVVANQTNAARAYCNKIGVKWPPFNKFDMEQLNMSYNNNARYIPIRQTSHSQHQQQPNNINMEPLQQEEVKMNDINTLQYDMDINNMNDEELQQQRQRHQDQYIESMPTLQTQNGYTTTINMKQRNTPNRTAGTVLSTVSLVTHRPRRNILYKKEETQQINQQKQT